MARLDTLLANYKRHLAVPLRPGLPLSQRVWFCVYPPEEERRLQTFIENFQMVTTEASLGWKQINLGGSFANWLDTFEPEERDEIKNDQELVESYAKKGFCRYLAQEVSKQAAEVPADQAPRTVFALTGLMDLYDFIDVSSVIDTLSKDFQGLLAVFFPGERDGTSYRFLNARTAWDYLAVPITCEEPTL